MTELISSSYLEAMKETHKKYKFGATAKTPKIQGYISNILKKDGYKDLLDYGAGRCYLETSMRKDGIKVTSYEPANEKLVHNNIPHNFVVCIDVLEHIEPDLLDNVLQDLHRVTLEKGLFTISLKKAKKVLPDGRNAHLIIESSEWWLQKLKPYFTILNKTVEEGQFLDVVVRPKNLQDQKNIS